jgi:hypothetical protein
MNDNGKIHGLSEDELAILQFADDGNPHCADVVTATCVERNDVGVGGPDTELFKERPMVGRDQGER